MLTIGHGQTLIEPVFYWPDAITALDEASVEAANLAKLGRHAPNPPVRALVEQLRTEVVTIFEAHGAAHFQIGRAYPRAQARSPAIRNLSTPSSARSTRSRS